MLSIPFTIKLKLRKSWLFWFKPIRNDFASYKWKRFLKPLDLQLFNGSPPQSMYMIKIFIEINLNCVFFSFDSTAKSRYDWYSHITIELNWIIVFTWHAITSLNLLLNSYSSHEWNSKTEDYNLLNWRTR